MTNDYEFEIQAHAKIIIEANSAEEARMALVNDKTLYEEEIMQDCYISEGELKPTLKYYG